MAGEAVDVSMDTSHWVVEEAFEVGKVPVSIHLSEKTGLRVCLAKVPGPIVSGFFTLATEAVTNDYAHADDGLPHTLEHLIFMGSELYPYKGMLDQLANRCLAEGTNAWTDTDHTAYTITTAGSEGFLNLLPVYLDHILYPTLTEDGFITEVHHIQPDGNDAGVVYCEMQARENTAGSLTHRRLLCELFPDSGYSSETGGLMERIRGLKASQMRRYHSDFYRPDNLCIIVTGQVEPAALYAAMASTEARILAKGPLPSQPRPWSSPVAPLTALPKAVKVEFPSDDESTGRVVLGWRGPSWDDFQAHTALRVLWLYLTDSSVSPLHQALVEVEEPLCGDIDFHMEEFSVGYQEVTFADAATDRLRELRSRFFDILATVCSSIDLNRMATVVARECRQVRNAMEQHPHHTFAVSLISFSLYGPKGRADRSAAGAGERSFAKYMDMLGRLQALPVEGESAKAFWRNLIRHWLVERPCVAVIGVPSARLGAENSRNEVARVERQTKTLGPDMLRMLGSRLSAANEANNRPCPTELLESVPVPSISSVSAIPVVTVRHRPAPWVLASAPRGGQDDDGAGAGGGEDDDEDDEGDEASKWVLSASEVATGAYGDGDSSLLTRYGHSALRRLQGDRLRAGAIPLCVQWDHVKTNFVKVTATLDTTGVGPRLRPLCPLLVESLLESPLKLPDGTFIPHGDVVRQLMADSVSSGTSVGIGGSSLSCGAFPQLLSVSLTFEADKYPLAVKWLRRLLLHTKFTSERLMVALNKLLAQIPARKRHGRSMVAALANYELFDFRSNTVATNVVRQQRFLEEVRARLVATPAEVQREMEELRSFVTQPYRMRFHVVCDVDKVPGPARVWIEQFSQAFGAHANMMPVQPVPLSKGLLKGDAVIGGTPVSPELASVPAPPAGRVAVLPALETSYLRQVTSCIESYSHKDYAALRVAIEYLTALEGDFWKRIRGLGLSYGYGISCSPEMGLLTFSLSKSTDVVQAQQVAHDIVDSYLSGDVELSAVVLDATKSSVVFSIVSREATVFGAGRQSLKNWLRGVSSGFNQRLVKQVVAVTTHDVRRVLNKYFAPLFDPARCLIAVTTATTKAQGVVSGLCEAGYAVRDVGRISDWFCAGMERRGAGRNRSIGGAASPDFHPDTRSSGRDSDDVASTPPSRSDRVESTPTDAGATPSLAPTQAEVEPEATAVATTPTTAVTAASPEQGIESVKPWWKSTWFIVAAATVTVVAVGVGVTLYSSRAAGSARTRGRTTPRS